MKVPVASDEKIMSTRVDVSATPIPMMTPIGVARRKTKSSLIWRLN